jgi:hypothetical protein
MAVNGFHTAQIIKLKSIREITMGKNSWLVVIRKDSRVQAASLNHKTLVNQTYLGKKSIIINSKCQIFHQNRQTTHLEQQLHI